jgi:hypothetical protein
MAFFQALVRKENGEANWTELFYGGEKFNAQTIQTLDPTDANDDAADANDDVADPNDDAAVANNDANRVNDDATRVNNGATRVNDSFVSIDFPPEVAEKVDNTLIV